MKKQIEEMAKCCTYYYSGKCYTDATQPCDCDLMCEMFGVFANIEKANYRKQSEGEWIWTESGQEDYEQYWVCSCCHEKDYLEDKFCPNCGAKMKGGKQ